MLPLLVHESESEEGRRMKFSIEGGVGQAVAAHLRCERCGSDLKTVEITAFGDSEMRLLPVMDCPCPGPRCPCCGKRLEDGKCPSAPIVECPVGWCIIPIPDVY